MLQPLAGGMPADDKGLANFVSHVMGLEAGTKESDEAISRIKKDEIGQEDTTPDGGEVKTEKVYAVNIIRRSEHGPFILEHMVKAMLKQAASRATSKNAEPGVKNELSEGSVIVAHGDSLQDPARPWEIYLRQNGGPTETEFLKVQGAVGDPKGGKRSISSDVEVAVEGSEFEFEIRYQGRKLKPDYLRNVVWAASQMSVGSCKAKEFGKFEVVKMEAD